MRKGLCWIGWLMAFVLILTFPLVASARIVVGYTPSDWDPADFHGMFGEGIEMGLRELGVDYEFLIRAAGDHTGHEIQLSIVEDFIAEGVDYVVINPTDPQAQRTSYEKVINAGIPLIIGNYRELLPEEWGFQPMMFAGYSHWDAGVTMANYIAEHYPPGTKVAIIHAAPGYVTEARSQVDLHKENGMDIVFEDYAYAERMRAYDSMKRIIAAYPDTEVVLCMSSMMAVGATEAMIAHGMEGEFDIYGSGGTIEELLYIEDGLMTAAWMRDPIAMGKAAAEAIYLHMSGQEDEIDLVFDSPIHIIDSVEAINLYVNPVLYEAQGLDFPR